MKKTRSNARWNGLSLPQQATLESWLFEDNLAYDDALAKAKTELGFTGSRSGLQRFYKVTEQKRLLVGLMDSGREASEIFRTNENSGVFRVSAMKLLSQQLFERVRTESITELPVIAKLLLQNEANEIRREQNRLQQEANELRRQRMELMREKWQFDVMDRLKEMLPGLLQAQLKQDQDNDPYFEGKRMNAIKRQLFGDTEKVYPENAEEERQMAEAKVRKEAEEKAEYEERLARLAAAQAAQPPVPVEPAPKPEPKPPSEAQLRAEREARKQAAISARLRLSPGHPDFVREYYRRKRERNCVENHAAEGLSITGLKQLKRA